ncbi:MAG: GWxTD domain-containing protein [Vicinamibacterales bacterium]
MSKTFPLALALFLLAASSAAAEAQRPRDWADTAEALFLTAEERREWASLMDSVARDGFKERYWQRRDPTPREAGNEFRDVVLGRIRRANDRFPLRGTPGSETARGRAFVLLGTPARISDRALVGPNAPPARGRIHSGMVGINEGTEEAYVWTYDRERTPALLDALGRPSLDLTFIVEPHRGTDRLQTPGLFDELRNTLAARSIVADVAPASPGPAPASAPLDIGVREKLGGLASHAEGVVSGYTVIWGASAAPELHAWTFIPRGRAAGGVRFHAIARDASGNEIAAWSTPALEAPAFFTTSREGSVFTARRALAPGQQQIQFGFTTGADWHAATSARLEVPDLGSKAFAVSPIVVSAGPGPATSGPSLGMLPARADATFALSESLWTVVEIANAAAPASVTLELTLARDGKAIGGTGEQPANLVELAAGRHLAAFELPLATLSPGDYTLALIVRPQAGSETGRVVREVRIRLVAR